MYSILFNCDKNIIIIMEKIHIFDNTWHSLNKYFRFSTTIFDPITEYAGMCRYRPTDTGYKWGGTWSNWPWSSLKRTTLGITLLWQRELAKDSRKDPRRRFIWASTRPSRKRVIHRSSFEDWQTLLLKLAPGPDSSWKFEVRPRRR